MPLVARIGKQIFNLEALAVESSKLLQVEINPTGLLLSWVEIDSYKNLVPSADLAVAKNIWIIDGMKMKRTVTVKRRIIATDVVDQRNQPSQTVIRTTVPAPDLVLLTIEIFFASWLGRCIFAKFKRRAIYTVVRPQRRR